MSLWTGSHGAVTPPRQQRPRVVATITSEEEAWRSIGLGAEVLEVRLDLIEDPQEGPALLQSLRTTGVPLIATNRSRREGGRWRGPEDARLDLLWRSVPYAAAVDLEVTAATTAIGRTLCRELPHTLALLILSRHDFRATPAPATLRSWFSSMFQAGADVAKVAVTARRPEDLHALLGVLEGQRRPVVGISMGAVGAPSRVMAGLFGSVLTYGCVDAPRAPGQIRVDALRRMIDTLYDAPLQGRVSLPTARTRPSVLSIHRRRRPRAKSRATRKLSRPAGTQGIVPMKRGR